MKIEFELKGGALAAVGVPGVAAALAAVSAAVSPSGMNPASPEAVVDAMVAEKDHVQPFELARWILEKRQDCQLIDLREPWEYDDYHIPAAVNIPLTQLFTPEGLKQLDRGRTVVVYGLGMGHPAQTQLLLSLKGYRALSLKDGITGWWDQVLTPQSLRGENPQPAGYQQARALREQFLGGLGQPPNSGAKTAPPLPAPPPAPAPGKASPKKLKLGRGCS